MFPLGMLAALFALFPGALGTSDARPQSAPAPAPQTACTYTLSPGAGAYGGIEGRGTFIVNAGPGCAWIATTSDPWIALDVARGIGSGTVVFTVAENSTGSRRSGAITVGPPPAQ